MKRRPPSDARALKGATDPGIVQQVLIALGLFAALLAGVYLLMRGLR